LVISSRGCYIHLPYHQNEKAETVIQARSGHDPKKNDPRIIFWPQKWYMIRNLDHFLSHDPWSGSFFQLWSTIRTVFSMIRSASDQIISLVLMIILQIEDHFYGSRIIFTDHGSFLRIADYFADRRLFDVAEKWSDNKMHLIRFICNPDHLRINDPWSTIRIILGSFFWQSGPLLSGEQNTLVLMREVSFFQFYGKMKEFRAKLIIRVTKFVEHKISYKMV